MGISVQLWRSRIGLFSLRSRSGISISFGLYLNSSVIASISLGVRIALFLLLVVHGIESNPGPPTKGINTGSPKVTNTSGKAVDQGSKAKTYRSPDADTGTPSQRFTRSASQKHDTTHQPTQASLDSFLSQPDRHGTEQSKTSLDDLKKIMLDVKSSMKSMESRFSKLETSFTDMEKTLNEVSSTTDELKENNMVLTSKVEKLEEKVTILEKGLQDSESKREKLESHSRRNNLRFYGLQEDKGQETWSDVEEKVKDFVRRELEIREDLCIERAHRLPSSETPRPVIVKFASFKMKDFILRTYRDAQRQKRSERDANLEDQEDKQVNISEDFPGRVMFERRKMRRFLKEAIENDKRAYFRYDTLVVEGQSYKYDSNSDSIVPIHK